jgi:cytochrome c peroxidase
VKVRFIRPSRRVSRPAWWLGCAAAILSIAFACSRSGPAPPWEEANPLVPLPVPPLGSDIDFASLKEPPTAERVRLGRWLFYDPRLSADGTVSCATCHRPAHAFSEPTPVSLGIRGQRGTRKAPTFINQAVTLYPHFFWDGRAASLEQQALMPIENPVEMGNTHQTMIETLSTVEGYRPYFAQAFGDPAITKERVARAIADYERTRMSGNSPWDRWRRNRDESAVSDQVKRGHDLFFDKAACNQCHLGSNFTDSLFHNLGVGWDPETKTFADDGRYVVTKQPADRGAFKTPTLRELTRRAPYMHDGSIATLREVVELYNRGGIRNPHLDPKITALKLTDADVDALVAFMQALDGEGYQDTPPAAFPQ